MISSRLFEFSVSILFVGISQHVSASADFPLYSQQCRDDAGPPFADDEEHFGKGGKYHDGSFARPILQNEQCAPPVKKACDSRPSKTAYLEGPIDCGGNGWYCRITKEDGWKNVNLVGDYNFGLCNSEEAFGDSGYDKDGHCHGSEDDSTYYWWVRDHWHRQYNGHLRCCCGWFEGSSSTAMYDQRIANRCDYRRLVKKGTTNKCRDANEGHGKGFELGCDKKYRDQIGSPIPEDNNICWEVSRFGYTEKKGGTKMPSVTGGSPAPSSEGGDSGSGDECVEDKKTKFFLKENKKGKVIKKTCKWLGKKSKKMKRKICARNASYDEFDPANIACPITCNTCDDQLSSI